jgi:threonine dehydrogenase-like Zn-dependent dehydrogenase
MGSLIALSIRRYYPHFHVQLVDPNVIRRDLARLSGIGDTVVESPAGEKARLVFVACSRVRACQEAIAATAPEGTVVLFSGLNTDEIDCWDAQEDHTGQAAVWERVHRHEETTTTPVGQILVGTSGYNVHDAHLAVQLLVERGRDFGVVQNVLIDELDARTATYQIPGPQRIVFDRPAVEALLSPDGIDCPLFGGAIAQSLKVLIRLGTT